MTTDIIEKRRFRYFHNSGWPDGLLMLKDLGKGIVKEVHKVIAKVEDVLTVEVKIDNPTKVENVVKEEKNECQEYEVVKQRRFRYIHTFGWPDGMLLIKDIVNTKFFQDIQLVAKIVGSILQEPKVEETKQINSLEDFNDVWRNGIPDPVMRAKTIKRTWLRILKFVSVVTIAACSLIYFKGPFFNTPYDSYSWRAPSAHGILYAKCEDMAFVWWFFTLPGLWCLTLSKYLYSPPVERAIMNGAQRVDIHIHE